MQSLSIELTLATGAARFPRGWDETDVPAVAPRDLAAGLRCCLPAGRLGGDRRAVTVCRTIEEAERRVLALFPDDQARGLAVLLRVRSSLAALESRRFRSLAQGRDPTCLLRLVVAAARLRLNATRGFSPVRLAWACAERSETVSEIRVARAA